MIDAAKRASAGRITAVIPYYAYGRTDKKDQPRVAITARLIADFISTAGADRVLTIDLHAGQIQGFFSIPVDELTAVPLLVEEFKDRRMDDLVVVATDVGAGSGYSRNREGATRERRDRHRRYSRSRRRRPRKERRRRHLLLRDSRGTLGQRGESDLG